jgi:hypothetical protein
MDGFARDTHFMGFTREVMRRLKNAKTDAAREIILARAAYDLAYHTIYKTSQGLDRYYIHERVIEQVPDLTEFPEDKV